MTRAADSEKRSLKLHKFHFQLQKRRVELKRQVRKNYESAEGKNARSQINHKGKVNHKSSLLL